MPPRSRELVAALQRLPPRTADPGRCCRPAPARCRRARHALAQLAAQHRVVRRGDRRRRERGQRLAGAPASFEALHALLEAQAYRLAYWRVASDEINYRRFFDVNDLAALRMENDVVFDATHAFVLRACRRRQDRRAAHRPPGRPLRPGEVLRAAAGTLPALVAATRAQPDENIAPLYVVLEKISASHERLPRRLAGAAATPAIASRTSSTDCSSTGERQGASRSRVARVRRPEALDFETTAVREQAGDHARPARRGADDARQPRTAHRARRPPYARLHVQRAARAIEEIVARFPVYRTYVSERGPSAQDRRYIDWAVARRAHGNPARPMPACSISCAR